MYTIFIYFAIISIIIKILYMTQKLSLKLYWSFIVTILVVSFSVVILTPTAQAAECPTLVAGNLFKVPDNSAVYLLNTNMERMYFPHFTVYKSWYEDYSGVVEIPNTCVDNYPVPSAPPYGVNYRPGSRLVKVQISPSVYAVEPGNKLVKIGSEEVAIALYGVDWASKVIDIADVFWPNYISRGSEIVDAVPHEGMFVKTIDSVDVFYIKNRARYKVDSNVRGDVQTVIQAVMDRLPDADSVFASVDIYTDPAQLSNTEIVNDEVVEEIVEEEVVEEVAGSVRLTNAIGNSINPSIVYNGTNFGLVWEDARDNSIGSDLYFAVVDSVGNKIVQDLKITNTPNLFSTNPEIVWNGNGYGLVYAEYSGDTAATEVVKFARLSSSGSLVGGILEIASGVIKPHPSIAWSNDGYGIVYRTPNNQQGKHYYAFVNSSGVIEKNPVKILDDEGSDSTEIVWDGEMFSIVYRQSPRVLAYGDTVSYTVGTYLYRVDKNGNAESPAKFVDGKEALAVVWTGSRYAVVEQEKSFSVFDKISNLEVKNIEISNVNLTKSDLVYNNGDYGFVGVNNNAVYFSEAGQNGVVKQSSVIVDETVSAVQANPRISTDLNLYVVVWSDNRDGNSGSEIYWKKMESN